MTRALLLLAGLALAPASFAQDAPPGLPRLTGIVVAPGVRVALFDGIAAEEGEQVGAYVVRLIRPDGVQVDADGHSLTLAPTAQGAAPRPVPADTGGVTFGLVVNPPGPAPD